MKSLAAQIRKELETARYCAVYETDLNRVWPKNGKRRETLVIQFARENGWRLRHYKDGFVAIFDKMPLEPMS